MSLYNGESGIETGGAPAGNGGSGEFGSETVLQSFTYQYDNSGNITKITEANREYIDYNYDNLNRLTEEHRKTTAGTTIYKIEYLFDNNDAKNGNIHQVVVNDTDTTTFTYNEMNELTGITHPDNSTETLTYDNNGNLTQTVNNTTGETTAYEWDCFDRLTKVILPPKYGAETGEEIRFTYDGDHKLTKIDYPDMSVDIAQSGIDTVRKVAHIRFNGQKTSTETDITTHLVHIRGQLLGQYNSAPGSNTPQYYHYDHNSNLALTTDQHGNIQEKPLMDAYGNVLPLPDSSGNKEALTLSSNFLTGGAGVFYIQRAKMYNMRRRFFNSSIRRFISVDSIVSFIGHYIFGDNSPILNSDPTGLLTIRMVPKCNSGKNLGYIEDFRHFGITVNELNMAIANVNGALKSDECIKAFKCHCPAAPENINSAIKIPIEIGFCATHKYYSGVGKHSYYRDFCLGGTGNWSNTSTGFSEWEYLGTDNSVPVWERSGFRKIFLSFLGLGYKYNPNLAQDALGRFLIHEITHFPECDVGGFFNHCCADLIAIKCGFKKLGMYGDLRFKTFVNNALDSYMTMSDIKNSVVLEARKLLNEQYIRNEADKMANWSQVLDPDTLFLKRWQVSLNRAEKVICKSHVAG